MWKGDFARVCAPALLILGMLSGAASAATPSSVSEFDESKKTSSIVEIVVSTPNLSTLASVLTAANLVTTLEGKGPFTVFAPTNNAFAAIPPGILSYLTSNIPVLTQVLLYHVAAGVDELGSDLTPTAVTTVQGEKVFAQKVFGKPNVLTINNSKVLVKPIVASNGIIYVIDSVLEPQFH